jgi:hypothetical protein
VTSGGCVWVGGWVGWVMLASHGNNTYTRVLGFLSDTNTANTVKEEMIKRGSSCCPPPPHMWSNSRIDPSQYQTHPSVDSTRAL